MKVFLLHPRRDFDVRPDLRDAIYDAMLTGNPHVLATVRRDLAERGRTRSSPSPPAGDELVADLELHTLWTAMAAGDELLYETAKRVLLSSLHDPDEITYRQRVLADCLAHPAVVREIYELAVTALANEREVASLWSGARPSSILHRSVRVLRLHLVILRQLQRVTDAHAHRFRSDGLTRFFAMVRTELSEDYLIQLEHHLAELDFTYGVVESAELGKGDKAIRYRVHEPPPAPTWRERFGLTGNRRPEQYSFELHPRDQAGAQALGEIEGMGINHVADAAAQSVDHVRSFFTLLRLELAFYLGCLNLHDRLAEKGEPTCFPEPRPEGQLALTAEGIYDVCLTLRLPDRAIGNDVDADGKSLVVITGANQGGKSTLLRGLGLAQLMMQAGMFVGARSMCADVRTKIFTHYKREEDATMEAGKLDEELARMSAIIDHIRPHALLVCNESFASTNEREGSEIARQLVRALLDRQVKVLFVTHMYDLAHGWHAQRLDTMLFLRAEREPDGTRTFKIREGEPLPTSYGADSFRRVFGDEPGASVAEGAREM
jgi:hypothetical protein